MTLGVVLVAGAAAAAQGVLTIGELVAFASLQLMLIWPVQSLGWIIANGQEAATAADRIQEVLDTPPQIVDAPDARTLAATRSTAGSASNESTSATWAPPPPYCTEST